MLHLRLTPVGATIGGPSSVWLAQIGPYGSWGDLQVITRWGDGASGMYEAQWTMPLPADFEHPLLRRGTIVELMDGSWRVGSPLVLAEPARGTGLDDPWQFVATGIGREVEGQNAYYAFDGTGASTAIASSAVDRAIADGLPWAGRDASVPTVPLGTANISDTPVTVGVLLNGVAESDNCRWRVGQDNTVGFKVDPTTPSYQVTPGAISLGTADDDYATVVYGAYIDSATARILRVTSPASISAIETTFGRKEYLADLTGVGPISTATAQSFTDGILALSKGRLAYTNSLTVTSNEILTMGGTPANLSKVLEDVANGCMVRLHGISNDLLAYNGQTWLDIVIGQARYTDGAQSIQLDPIGMAARDLAAIIEQVTGVGDAA